MPAIAYTSGMFSLPSAATRGGRSAVADLYSVLKVRPELSLRPLKDRPYRCTLSSISAGPPIGTHCQGAHPVEGTARGARN